MLKDDGTTHLADAYCVACSGVASSLSISLPSRSTRLLLLYTALTVYIVGIFKTS